MNYVATTSIIKEEGEIQDITQQSDYVHGSFIIPLNLPGCLHMRGIHS